jgi:hypothetical protein
MQQNWAGLGGGGLTISFQILKELHNSGYLRLKKDTDQPKDLPPGPGETQSQEDDYSPYLTAYGSDIGVTYYGFDTDEMIFSSLEEDNPETYKSLLRDHENYFTVPTGRGTGAGGIYERIEAITENYPVIQENIKQMFNGEPGLFIPMFSLDGGSGYGFFREHLKLVDRNEILSRDVRDPSTIIPVTIAPHKTDGNRDVVWESEGIRRNASESVSEALEYIDTRLGGRSGLLDAVFYVDNDFAAFNAICNDNAEYGYDYVRQKIAPIQSDLDYSEFTKATKHNLNYENANRGIINSTLPLFMMALRAPDNVKFGKHSQEGYDHKDMAGFFAGNYVVPSYFNVSHRGHLNELFAEYSLDSSAKELAYLSYYTFLISCAPIYGENVENVNIFIWSDDHGGSGIGSDIRQEIVDLFSQIGISQEDITVDPVVGINDPNSIYKIWTLTGMDEVQDVAEEKFW